MGGCKAPKPKPPIVKKPMFAKMAYTSAGKSKGVVKGKGKDKGKDKGKGNDKSWKCECGFLNKPQNQVCGGEGGTLGCKKPKSWECVCGFTNKQSNEVCGGNGPMG